MGSAVAVGVAVAVGSIVALGAGESVGVSFTAASGVAVSNAAGSLLHAASSRIPVAAIVLPRMPVKGRKVGAAREFADWVHVPLLRFDERLTLMKRLIREEARAD